MEVRGTLSETCRLQVFGLVLPGDFEWNCLRGTDESGRYQ
jgi:hypothetical protein